MTSSHTVADVSRPGDLVLADTAAPDEVRLRLSPGGLAVIGDPAHGLLTGVVRFERLSTLSEEEETLDGVVDSAALVPGRLGLERAFRILLGHAGLRWLVTETGAVLARERLVPASLERFAGSALDRSGLFGDPVAPASGLSYRCPAKPGEHVFAPAEIEAWTTDLKARCPVDGRLMTAFLPLSSDEE
ncbi:MULTISPECIES: hypothetical protein [unclassified Streptomyces]|uniref:hypothetical protein n=1 Tax=unclassified Streptomyces TaxID=2593676 RepID=UPI002366E2B1|nr:MULTISPECIES: hypothetical protein [unclassified Streptomyces]MDF3148026.1 hypothetical protein [Streptomyces sp. T21Q-yed]WDF43178.1 hypothetical protein PBV52_43530 [Streptomyces sp. T12]